MRKLSGVTRNSLTALMRYFSMAVRSQFFLLLFAGTDVLALSPHKLDKLHIVGLKRTSEEWLIGYLGIQPGAVITEKKLESIESKLQNLLIFSSTQISPTYHDENLVDLEIIVDEKWTTIPVVRGSYGGGTPMTVLGFYDTNSFGRMYTLGIETHKYGDAVPGLVSWFKAPYLYQGKAGFSIVSANHHRVRQLYNGKNLDSTSRYLQSAWSTVDLEWVFAISSPDLSLENSPTTNPIRIGLRLLSRNDYSHIIEDSEGEEIEESSKVLMSGGLLHRSTREYFVSQVVFRSDSLQENMSRFVGKKYEFKLGFERDSLKKNHAFHEMEGFYFPSEPFLHGATLAFHGFAGVNYSPSLNSRYYLGGFDSVRGYPDGFVYGKGAVFGNVEIRKSISYTPTIAYEAVGFIDAGNAFDPDIDFDSGVLCSAGGGFRISFPRIYRMMFRLDFGKTLTKTNTWGFSAGLNHFFQPRKPL